MDSLPSASAPTAASVAAPIRWWRKWWRGLSPTRQDRFAALAPYLDDDLQSFYLSLLRSEARHYQDYLALAQQVSADDISSRVRFFGEVEAALITSPDDEFRFHSGVPA